MKVGEIVPVTSRGEWRTWLEAHGDIAAEAWVLLYKKSAGKPGLRYEETVEEALCFGWVDGFMRSYDSDRTVNRFTPRRPKSSWSRSNRQRALDLMEAGLMKPSGLAKLPEDLRVQLNASEEATA